jgi:ubiquinone/menaquinone biosynthesis C-methylase UbiE
LGFVTEPPPYVLGSGDAEIARRDAQAAMSAPATHLLLAAGKTFPGMRVLDLDTALGHLASEVASLIGAEGRVVGIDQVPRMVEIAERRRVAAGLHNVAFAEADLRTFRDHQPFGAIVGRVAR